MLQRPQTREADAPAAGRAAPGAPAAHAAPTPPPAPESARPHDALGSVLARAVAQRAGTASPAPAVLARVRTNRGGAAKKATSVATPPPAPTYEYETFDDGSGDRERTTKVTARVVPTAVPSREKTPLALAFANRTPPLGFDGGHVIGLHLGGKNVSNNVVPMYPRFNRGIWKSLEDDVKRRAAAGAPLTMTVTIAYGGADPGIPSAFNVRLVDTLANTTTTWNLRQPEDIAPVAALPTGAALALNAVDAYKRPLPDPRLLGSASPFLLGDAKTFGAAVAAMGGKALPVSAKAMYPDKAGHRYYSHLDVLVMNGSLNETNVPGLGTMGPFSDFSAAQRELLLQVNMHVNGGLIKSDDPADPHQVLDPAGAANAPEIDHIIPKVLGGSNYFSNARVVSWELNNKEDRIKSIADLVDVRRLAPPTLPTGKIEDKAAMIATQWRAFHPKGTDVKRAAVQGWIASRWPAIGPTPSKKMIDSVLAKIAPALAAKPSPPKRKAAASKGIVKPPHKRGKATKPKKRVVH